MNEEVAPKLWRDVPPRIFTLYAEGKRTYLDVAADAVGGLGLVVDDLVGIVTPEPDGSSRACNLAITDIEEGVFTATNQPAMTVLSVRLAGLWVHLDATKPWVVVRYQDIGVHYELHTAGCSPAMLGSLGRRLMMEEEVSLQMDVMNRLQRDTQRGIVLAQPNLRNFPGRSGGH